MKIRLLKIFIILIALSIITFLLISCYKNYSPIYKEDNIDNKIENALYFKNIDNSNNHLDTKIYDFEDRIKSFSKFNEDFFNIWSKYIDHTEYLLKNFNEEKDNLNLKASYAKVLVIEYDKFSKELSCIEVPDFADNAYKYGLGSVIYRKLYFEHYIGNIDKYNFGNINKLNYIENQAYLCETKFWEELDKIYIQFDADAKKLRVDEIYTSLKYQKLKWKI